MAGSADTTIEAMAAAPPLAASGRVVAASPAYLHRCAEAAFTASARGSRPGSFLLPLLIWSAVSYLPFLWHPLVAISDPGAVDYLEKGMRLDRGTFVTEVANAAANHTAPPQGKPANPVYLPAPHEVALALWDSIVHPPTEGEAIRMPQSLWHSIQVIFWGFAIFLAARRSGRHPVRCVSADRAARRAVHRICTFTCPRRPSVP